MLTFTNLLKNVELRSEKITSNINAIPHPCDSAAMQMAKKKPAQWQALLVKIF